MAGDPLATMETLNGMAGDAHVQLLFDQRVGHGVVVTVYLDVIVDVYAHPFPLGIRIGLGGQGLQFDCKHSGYYYVEVVTGGSSLAFSLHIAAGHSLEN